MVERILLPADRLARSARVAICVGAFALIAFIGLIDAATTALVAFSIFYITAIFLATWFGDRAVGLTAAAASAFTGLAADLWTMGADRADAYANLALRLILFVVTALVFARLQATMRLERSLTQREREVAEQLRALNTVKDELMRSVAIDARAPLGDIYARVVTLGFDIPTLSAGESRQVLGEIAEASRQLSELVNQLIPDEAHMTSSRPGTANRAS